MTTVQYFEMEKKLCTRRKWKNNKKRKIKKQVIYFVCKIKFSSKYEIQCLIKIYVVRKTNAH